MSDLILLARNLCVKWHQGQTRRYSGEPYHNHPFRVAKKVEIYLQELSSPLKSPRPEEILAAAYLHDVLEDVEEVTKKVFLDTVGNERVYSFVQALTNPPKKKGEKRKERKKIVCKNLSQAPPAVKLIKACDRMDNLPEIMKRDPDFGEIYLPESIELHRALEGRGPLVPLARKASSDLNKIILDLEKGI